MASRRDEELSEPLLSQENGGGQVTPRENDDDDNVLSEQQVCPSSAGVGSNGSDDDDGDQEQDDFSIQNEIWEMITLGLPLAVSFFCRMGMASTDSSFVGHINNAEHSAETYLAAAVLSDLCVTLFITPPLAFNQVLNALVGQAMGSGNPQMAGVWLQQSMFWLSVTMLPCLVGFFFVEPILVFLDFPTTVAHVAGTYAKYNLLWPIPNGLYQCMRFYFQAQGLPRPAMYNNIIFLFVNALLNWIFVFGGPFRYLGWTGFGFIGAAISLSISRTAQAVTYFCYMFVYKRHHVKTWPGCSLAHHTKARTVEFMKQSLPNIGTLLFQVLASQATTVLVGRLGELSIAASSALSTVTIPFAGSLSATCSTISGVRVGYHLGKGNAHAAQQSTWMVLYFITAFNVLFAIVFASPTIQPFLLDVATNDTDVQHLASVLIPAMLVSTYLNLIVGNITSGVFGGQGRPFIATLLSFGLELPLSIGGVAIYILLMKGNLLGVYWWNAISGGIEAVIVLIILIRSNWNVCAEDAQRRQEANRSSTENDDDDDVDGGQKVAGKQDCRDNNDLQEPLLADQMTSTDEANGHGNDSVV